MDWKKLAERLLAKIRPQAEADAESVRWARQQTETVLHAATEAGSKVLVLIEGEAAAEYKRLVGLAEKRMIEDMMVALGERRTDDAIDLARMVDGQRRAVGLIEEAVRKGAAASLELARRSAVIA